MAHQALTRSDTVYRRRQDRWPTVQTVLFFLVIAAVSAIALTAGPIGVVVGGANMLIFLGLAAVTVTELMPRKPDLTITDDGVDHPRLGHIQWEAVDHVRVRSDLADDNIDLVLIDPGLGTAEPAVATIAAKSVPVSAETVLAAMRRHRPGLEITRRLIKYRPARGSA